MVRRKRGQVHGRCPWVAILAHPEVRIEGGLTHKFRQGTAHETPNQIHLKESVLPMGKSQTKEAVRLGGRLHNHPAPCITGQCERCLQTLNLALSIEGRKGPSKEQKARERETYSKEEGQDKPSPKQRHPARSLVRHGFRTP
jgi:hypothetical protein